MVTTAMITVMTMMIALCDDGNDNYNENAATVADGDEDEWWW